MNRFFFSSVIFFSVVCVFLCTTAIGKTSDGISANRSDSSTENGIPSFLISKDTISKEIIKKEKIVTKNFITQNFPKITKKNIETSISSLKNNKSFFLVKEGLASWYGKNLHNNLTASGELFDMNSITAAHKELSFGTLVEVFNKSNGLSVIVKINDRGPFVNGRIINLSYAAAKKIDLVDDGITEVTIKVIDD